jgi:enoyl-CoA hydratase/carnithine racemase
MTAEMGLYDGVRLERRDDVLHVTLALPEVRNAQTPAMWRRLAAVPSVLDDSVRAVVLRGDGASFSAGLDRRMFTPEGVPGEESVLSLAGRSPAEIDAFIVTAQSAFAWWSRVPQVTVALVQGHAIGAGFQLALACDVLIVGSDASLAMRETSLGLVPDLCGTAPLVERVGYARAFGICATGRFVEAQEAVAIGLAIAHIPQTQWEAGLADLLTPIRAAQFGAVAELKQLLQGASSSPDQPARERAAQVRRLQDLHAQLGGGA